MEPRRISCPFLVVLLVCLLLIGSTADLAAQTPFETMDRDHDGQLSRSEFRGPPPAFKRLDQNKDGYISENEASGTRLSGDARPLNQLPPRLKAKIGHENAYGLYQIRGKSS